MEQTIAERVKLRKQKADDEDLMMYLKIYMPPLKGNEEQLKEGKR